MKREVPWWWTIVAIVIVVVIVGGIWQFIWQRGRTPADSSQEGGRKMQEKPAGGVGKITKEGTTKAQPEPPPIPSNPTGR